MIQSKLDVRNYLYSMMETEKLKLLLFDKNQYFIFQHLPKPIMFDKLIYKKDRRKRSQKTFKLTHMEHFWNLSMHRRSGSINSVNLRKIKEKKALDLIDERLIDMLNGFKTKILRILF